MLSCGAEGASVTLAWDQNPEPDIAGYRVHYGTVSHNYTDQIDAGNATTATVPNLTAGTTYYFAATAYTASGAESSYSNEVTYGGSSQTPTPTPPGTPTPTPGSTPSPTSSPNPSSTPLPTPSATATATVGPTSTPVPGGPLAAYNFNEGMGTTLTDVSGNGITGAIQDATWTSDGRYGGALSFNGSSSYVDLGNPGLLQLSGSMTWSAWVKAAAAPEDDGQFISKSDNASGWQLKTSPDTGPHTFGVAVSGAANNRAQRYSTTVCSPGVWYHVAGVYNAEATRLDIYVNGVLDNGTLNGTIPLSQVNSSVNVNIGRRSGGFYFSGVIDDLRIYGRALSQSEIQTDMNTPVGSPLPTATPTPGQTPSVTPIPTPSATPGLTPTPTPTPGATATPSPTPPSETVLANVSTRLFVQSGNSVMIGGFIVYGDLPKRLILRAIGPSLAAFGISDAMPDPVLQLFDSSGSVIGSNDNWRSDQGQIIQDTGLAPSDDREAALVAVLSPDSYTAVVSDATETPGVALFELYDLDASNSQLINLSTRGIVQTQDRVMIGGLIISGQQSASFILRAIGPSLAQSGIQDPLLDPTLELYDGQGSLVRQNDNWRSDQEQQIINSHLAPSDDREPAILATLSPGPYSAVVRGAANSTGTALFEIYKLLP